MNQLTEMNIGLPIAAETAHYARAELGWAMALFFCGK